MKIIRTARRLAARAMSWRRPHPGTKRLDPRERVQFCGLKINPRTKEAVGDRAREIRRYRGAFPGKTRPATHSA